MRILLVRLRLIGDVVFTTPILRALRRNFPAAHLTYLVEPLAAPVVHRNPHLNELIVIPRRSGWPRIRDDLRLARRLRRERFDVAIDFHGGPRAAWFAWSSRAPMRIGYTIAGRTWMYTHAIPRAAGHRPRHSVTNQWDLLAPLGIVECDPARDPLEMREDPALANRLDRRLRESGIEPEHSVVLIHVSAGNPFRRWPVESFARVAASLVEQDPNRRVVLVSGPSEPSAAVDVARAARARAGAAADAIVAGEYDLAELHALAARAAVYIGTDSGPLHVAATTRTPIVQLLGPKLAEQSRPWRDARWSAEIVDVGALPCRPCDERRCEPGDFRCLTGITPERIIAAAERAMESAGPGPGTRDPGSGIRSSPESGVPSPASRVPVPESKASCGQRT